MACASTGCSGRTKAPRISNPSSPGCAHARYVERARAKLEYSSLGASFCDDEFTVGELRTAYEAVWGVELDPRNFHRKVTGTPGFLVETGRTTTRGGGRPAMLYTARNAALNPPPFRS